MADTKQQWYKDAKYGLFIHWGLYSILAGEWKDPKTGEVTKTDRIEAKKTDEGKLVKEFLILRVGVLKDLSGTFETAHKILFQVTDL